MSFDKIRRVPWTEFDYNRLPTTTASYRRDHKYCNLIAGFDLESTNYHNLFAFMYVWQFGVGDQIVYGRTWADFREFLANLKASLHLNVEFKLIVFDHNLKFDFGFFCREVPVDGSIIAKSRYEVLLCTVFDCFEYHDSYNYSEKSLEAMGEEIGIPKVSGYDYSKIRHSETELDDFELGYICTDVEILIRYYTKQAEQYGGVGRIPLTATQRVKKLIYDQMVQHDSKSKLMMWKVRKRQLKPDDPQDQTLLKMLRVAFFGGFNYCTTMYKGQMLPDVEDYDADSHYIAQILLHKYPRDRFAPLPVPKDRDQLEDLKKHKGIYKDMAMLITFVAEDVEAKLDDVAFLPVYSKNYIEAPLADRRSMVTKKMAQAGRIEATMTDVDFYLLFKYYNIARIKIKAIMGTPYGVLPDYITNSCVDLYTRKRAAKITLRKIKEQREPTAEEQAAYDLIKSFLNRIYGIFVQDPVKTNYVFIDGSVTIDKANRINTKKTQFAPVLYQWGVWVASWARYELLTLFSALCLDKEDGGKSKYNHRILYCDTDSIKGFDLDTTIIAQYNAKVKERVRKFCERKRLDFSLLDGLGEFERTHYDYFKTIGQKSYAWITPKGEFRYHISGLAQPKPDEQGIERCYFDKFETLYDKMEAFDYDMHVQPEESGLLESIYGGELDPQEVTDCNGQTITIKIRSYVLLQQKGFKADKDLLEMLEDCDEDRVLMMAAKFGTVGGGSDDY